jgi:hypothetical protein
LFVFFLGTPPLDGEVEFEDKVTLTIRNPEQRAKKRNGDPKRGEGMGTKKGRVCMRGFCDGESDVRAHVKPLCESHDPPSFVQHWQHKLQI